MTPAEINEHVRSLFMKWCEENLSSQSDITDALWQAYRHAFFRGCEHMSKQIKTAIKVPK